MGIDIGRYLRFWYCMGIRKVKVVLCHLSYLPNVNSPENLGNVIK